MEFYSALFRGTPNISCARSSNAAGNDSGAVPVWRRDRVCPHHARPPGRRFREKRGRPARRAGARDDVLPAGRNRARCLPAERRSPLHRRRLSSRIQHAGVCPPGRYRALRPRRQPDHVESIRPGGGRIASCKASARAALQRRLQRLRSHLGVSRIVSLPRSSDRLPPADHPPPGVAHRVQRRRRLQQPAAQSARLHAVAARLSHGPRSGG